jgi:hypothetical protein
MIIVTLTQFRNRFTLDEKRLIYSAAKVSIDIQIYLDDLASAGERGVDLSSPGTVAGINALVAAGILKAARGEEILGSTGFGFTAGQQVRVLAPFTESFPGSQTIEGFTDDVVQLEGGAQFAPHFLEAA